MAVKPEWGHRDVFTFKLIKIRCNSICWWRLRTFNYILTAFPRPLPGGASSAPRGPLSGTGALGPGFRCDLGKFRV